jgi:hypothetical protein
MRKFCKLSVNLLFLSEKTWYPVSSQKQAKANKKEGK